MCRRALFILSLCLVNAVTGSAVNSSIHEKFPTVNLKEEFRKIKSCVYDFIKGNGSCLTIDDVRKTYVSRFDSVRIQDNHIAPLNISMYLRIGLIENVFKHDEIKGFYNASGPQCVKSKGLEILQCVEDTITDVNKTTMHSRMHFSLLKNMPFQLEEIQFIQTAKILNCTLNIMRTSCNQTVKFIKSIGDYTSKEFLKYKHEKFRPSPPAASRKATIIIIVIIIVVILLIAAFLVIKMTLWRRWRRRSEDYQCAYVNKEQ